jgi:hypothetical protein
MASHKAASVEEPPCAYAIDFALGYVDRRKLQTHAVAISFAKASVMEKSFGRQRVQNG